MTVQSPDVLQDSYQTAFYPICRSSTDLAAEEAEDMQDPVQWDRLIRKMVGKRTRWVFGDQTDEERRGMGSLLMKIKQVSECKMLWFSNTKAKSLPDGGTINTDEVRYVIISEVISKIFLYCICSLHHISN